MEKQQSNNDDSFRPYGTVLFMILLFTLAAIIWFSVYNLQVQRLN